MDYGRFAPYVSVAQRRANAAREIKTMEAKGRTITPVAIEGRKIATTFWGKGWCEHMESFHDYENRLPRGKTYVRNGSVVDLQIAPGKITALVAGSSLYKIEVSIEPLKPERWQALKASCAGKIASVLELLKGGVSAAVMEIMSHRQGGMFPQPGEITMKCSCPDMAGMCKHLAAVLYGVGPRLDRQPELLFTLRRTDPAELIAQAATGVAQALTTTKKRIADSALSDVFGIELHAAPPENPVESPPAPAPAPAHRIARSARVKPAPPPATPRASNRRTAASRPPKATPQRSPRNKNRRAKRKPS